MRSSRLNTFAVKKGIISWLNIAQYFFILTYIYYPKKQVHTHDIFWRNCLNVRKKFSWEIVHTFPQEQGRWEKNFQEEANGKNKTEK